jgi:hypothetical protein
MAGLRRDGGAVVVLAGRERSPRPPIHRSALGEFIWTPGLASLPLSLQGAQRSRCVTRLTDAAFEMFAEECLIVMSGPAPTVHDAGGEVSAWGGTGR